MKGFKYQTTLKVMFKKYKPNGEIEFRPVYLIKQQKQWGIINLVLNMIFKKFYKGLIAGLIKDLAKLLNLLSINTLPCQLRNHYQAVLT